MAPSAYEQSEAGMGGREEGARGAQTHRSDDERASGRTADPRVTTVARGGGRSEEASESRLDVLWTSERANGHNGRDGRLSTGKEESRWLVERHRESET